MKVYTRIVMDSDFNVVEEESEFYEYEGPVAKAISIGDIVNPVWKASADILGGGSDILGNLTGGGKTQETKTNTAPWKEQQPYLKEIFQKAQSLHGQGPAQYYPGSTVATLSPEQKAAQDYMRTYATQALPQGMGNVFGAWGQQLDATNVMNNPFLAQTVQAAIDPIQKSLMEKTLPGIGSAAEQQGAFGGARQGLLEGQAVGDATQAMLDTTSRMYSDAYNTGLNLQANAIGMAPTMFNMGMMPGNILKDVGQDQFAYQQALIDANKARWDMEQNADWASLGNYMNVVQGNYGGTSTQTAPGTNPWLAALGGAGTGAVIGGPYGALIGGGIGLLGSVT